MISHMVLRKCKPSAGADAPSISMAPLNFSKKAHEKAQLQERELTASPMEADVDIDLREVYFLIMHFLSAGPCRRTIGHFWNELLEHQLLPRRYHAWYSRSGLCSGDEDDNGLSFPLSYNNLMERYPHVEKDHLVKLLKQSILSNAPPLHGMVGGNAPNAADVPTLLGSGSFSLLDSDRNKEDKKATQIPGYLRWPHMQADQVRGLSLREIGGGFTKHHRAPSIRAACYAIAKPSTMVQKMQIIKKLRGHQNAVYCAIFDRSGRYVITGSDDRLVKIWSMETAFCLSGCRGHEGDITDLAVSSNNTLVASASNDCSIRVWRLPDGLPISVLRGHTAAVTAIAFSPRLSAVYQLLSSSDDGTCRIWDARYSQFSPRIYIPKPSDDAAGKSNDHPPSTSQQGHQILCCAYNANGTVFVTGSSDTYARVWNAVKCNPEDSEQPNHEMDVLSGHENDVNYVQFSGCAVASRSSTMDTSKEENFPKFKNSWFTHDNIVTCSRDGSAIIWIPRSRRSHGKVGRWTRAYHLKVPPPPMPPQPPRGGPRQRFQPTPRGVNMIVWSLDNRFVLAAIMDCRICVWNAVDGSLVHSLTGHSESTYVLDVHPFNPRIAMSAGYDGKTIVWDIWEGAPVRTYETGRFKLVDGKFSPDGTSIVLSDEVGQIYILASGQGESQKDAKYDQFFLGDYRPLIQDTHGNVLDQETQLAPHRRNIQDLLCDSSMIPYPEPYQSMYQQRRLGALGIEWRPPSVKFAVGPGEHFGLQDYPMLPIPDLDRLIEPLPEFLDAMDWEQENEVQSDGSDSEYNVPEEYSSEGEQVSLSAGSSGDPECSAEDSEADHVNKDGLRRSRRKKHKAEVEVMTSSGRRVKRKNLDQRDGTLSKSNRRRKSKHGRLASKKKKSSKSKSSRPQRLAARNALNLFSQISGASTDGEEEEGSENDSSESESELPGSNIQSNESDRSIQNVHQKHQREKEESDECETEIRPPEPPVCESNTVNRRRLVLKLPVRDPKKLAPPESTKTESHGRGYVMGPLGKTPSEMTNLNQTYSSTQELGPSGDTGNAVLPQNYFGINIRERGQAEIEDKPDLSVGYKDNKIRWGEVKARTSKRLRLEDIPSTDAWPALNASLDGQSPTEEEANGHLKSDDEYGTIAHSENQTHGDRPDRKAYRSEEQFRPRTSEGLGDTKDKHPIPAYEHNSSLVDFSSNGPCNGNTTETTQLEDMGYGDRPGTSKYGGYDERSESADIVTDNRNAHVLSFKNSMENIQGVEENTKPIARKLRIKSKGILKEPENLSTSKPNSVTTKEDRKFFVSDLMSGSSKQAEHDRIVGFREEEDGNGGPLPDHRAWDVGLGKSGTQFDQDSKRLHAYSNNMSNAVCRRSKSYQARADSEADICGMEESTSNASNHDAVMEMDFPEAGTDGARRTRSMGTKATTREQNPAIGKFKVRTGHGIVETSRNVERFSLNGHEEWNSGSRVTVGLRSARSRRENYYDDDLSPRDRRKTYHGSRKPSWLMLTEHEESYRYIPQKGDEVVYVRKGHQQYSEWSHSHEAGPWRLLKGNIQSVEFCKVVGLDYSTLPGSGESCCKLTLEFVDPCSSVFGKTFKLTLPELLDFSDFLVERTRYDAANRRNWTHRDKCQVWWRNENEEGGSWWDGRIMAVKPKSPEFPDCPWERCVIQYRSDASEPHFHSPWELHDPDSRWEHPRIDEDITEELLSSFAKLENIKNQEHFGIQKLKKVSQKSDFLNRFPVPLSLEVIKRRLENNYYRSLEAVQHDIMVMLSNFQSYFGKNAELSAKVRRLSDWMTRLLSSLSGTETFL